MMITKANIAGRPIVTATQMLESMINAPRPTRAECADVANAVLDGTCSVMLSGETANGDYPTEAVSMMSHTCLEAENMINYDEATNSVRKSTLSLGKIDGTESVAYSACSTAFDIGASCIIVLTETGNTAQKVAKYKPSVPIIVITTHQHVASQCAGFVKNCRCKVVDSMGDPTTMISDALASARDNGICKAGDKIVAIYGDSVGVSGSTNTLQILQA